MTCKANVKPGIFAILLPSIWDTIHFISRCIGYLFTSMDIGHLFTFTDIGYLGKIIMGYLQFLWETSIMYD